MKIINKVTRCEQLKKLDQTDVLFDLIKLVKDQQKQIDSLVKTDIHIKRRISMLERENRTIKARHHDTLHRLNRVDHKLEEFR